MKRLGCLIVAVCLLFLVGCGNGRKDDLPPEPIAFGFTEADFGEIIFNDYRVTDDILTVDLSRNNRLREILESLCYNEAEGDITPEGVEKYSLYFGSRAFRFYEDGTVLYSDGINGEIAVLLYGEGLSYLDGVTAGAAASVGEYSEDAEITVHTPGHSPGHLCFWEDEKGYLFSGDLVYEGTLFANYPSTDPQNYLASLEKIAVLPTKRLFPGHHSLDIRPELIIQMRDAFRRLNEDNKLCHGSGTHNFGNWAIAL